MKETDMTTVEELQTEVATLKAQVAALQGVIAQLINAMQTYYPVIMPNPYPPPNYPQPIWIQPTKKTTPPWWPETYCGGMAPAGEFLAQAAECSMGSGAVPHPGSGSH